MRTTTPTRPDRAEDAATRAERRIRGRRERERRHYGFSLYTPPEEITDPIAHLEKQRGPILSRLESIIADPRTDPKLLAQVCVYLLKFSSLGKVRTDLGEQLAKLLPQPDLARLSPAMLDRILSGDAIELPELTGPDGAIDITPDGSDPAE